MLLEATLENATQAPMLLDAVTFLPSPAYSAERIGATGPQLLGAGTEGGTAGPLRYMHS
jgi:hypothetical protein